jgi:hypothetical protein
MPRKQVWQRHHCTYPDGRHQPPAEWVVRVTKGEHHVITLLQRLGSLSDGARAAILYEISRKPRRPEED